MSTCRCTLLGDGSPKGGTGTILVHFGDTFTTTFSHTQNMRWYSHSPGSAQEEDREAELEESPGRQPNVLHRREKVKQINLRFALIYDSPSGGRKNGYRSAAREEVEQDVLAGQSKLLAARWICLMLFVVLYVKD